jgi:uncharacterized membrane protein YphA (DoxX/SURF4 family)
MFWKNFAIAGGFLELAASDTSSLSLDGFLSRRRATSSAT